MLGSWSAQGRAEEAVTLRAALAERAAAAKMILHYARGCEVLGQSKAGFVPAIRAARQADVVIVALGEEGGRTGEAASRAHLDLEGQQQALLQAIAATGKPVILVLFSGRPLTISWAANHVPVILEAWFPGLQAGPALVRTLFGDVNPSGRLTATFPRSVGQEPIYYNTLSTGRPPPSTVDLSVPPSDGLSRFVSRYLDEPNAPLYPFGFGLSYTTFSFSQVTASTTAIRAASLNDGSAAITVRATVANTGERPGTIVVQCYIRLTGTTVARPVRELRAFNRIDLAAQQSTQVEFHLGRKELAFWNLDMKERVEPATLTVWIAPDATSGSSTVVKIVD
jgi:beta-glucosidase